MPETSSHPIPDHDSTSQVAPAATPLNIIIGGLVLAFLTVLAGLIGFLSIKQAPAHPPVVEQSSP